MKSSGDSWEAQPLLSADNCAPTPATKSVVGLSVGARSITLLGSIALVLNNISGPGMLEFPATFQAAGYVPCLVLLAIVTVISSACATLLADAMARIPGNSAFEARHEFSDVTSHFLGQSWFGLTQGAFYLCLLSQNVAAIVSTAQVLDALVAGFVFGKTFALQLRPIFGIVEWDAGDCSTAALESGSCVPFSYEDGYAIGDGPGRRARTLLSARGLLLVTADDGAAEDAAGGSSGGSDDDNGGGGDSIITSSGLILSLGYVLCAALFMHAGFLNLEENITMQVGSFVSLLTLTVAFLAIFWAEGLEGSRVPAVGNDWMDCVGVIIFNFAFCVTVPSWLNEKAPGVSVNQVVWTSAVAAAVMYAGVGWLGGLAFDRCVGG